MKVIIAGGRDFKDYGFLKNECSWFLDNCRGIEIVSGGQVTKDKATGKKYGADYLGEQFAKEMKYPLKVFPADWNKHGKAAGPIRNKEMAKYAHMLIAFWDGKSDGTRNMIEEARKAELKVFVVNY